MKFKDKDNPDEITNDDVGVVRRRSFRSNRCKSVLDSTSFGALIEPMLSSETVAK
jgi:hypothetical protein